MWPPFETATGGGSLVSESMHGASGRPGNGIQAAVRRVGDQGGVAPLVSVCLAAFYIVLCPHPIHISLDGLKYKCNIHKPMIEYCTSVKADVDFSRPIARFSKVEPTTIIP